MAELTPDEYQQALQDRESANLQGLSLRDEAGAPYYHAQTIAQVMDDRLKRMQARAQQDDADQFQTLYQDAILSRQDPFNVNPTSTSSSLSGWATAPEGGGLGLAGRASQASSSPVLNHQQQQGQDFTDFFKQLPWPVRASLIESGGVGALATQFSGKREALAAQLAQQEEAKQEHYRNMTMKMIESGNYEGLKALGEQYKYAPAVSLSQALSQSDLARIPDLMNKGYITQEQADAAMSSDPKKRLSPNSIRSIVKLADQMDMEDAKANAKEAFYRNALNAQESGKPLTPAQQNIIEERQVAKDLKDAQTNQANSRAALDDVRAANEWLNEGNKQGGPDRSTINRIAIAQTGMPFDELPAGGPAQKAVMQEYAKLIPQGRTDVQMGTPVPVQQRNNIIKRSEFLKNDKLVNPPPGATEGSLRYGDYVEVTDKQKENWGEVVNSGMTLDSLFKLIDPIVTARTPMQAGKQWTQLTLGAASKKNAAAATYKADSEAFSSRLSRVFGSEVGVLTQGDIDRWLRALPTFGDTVEVKNMKKKVFTDIYQQAREMTKKKIAGEDITPDLEKLRATQLSKIDKIAPPSIDEDLNTLMGGK
jgi:hypothetical protein